MLGAHVPSAATKLLSPPQPDSRTGPERLQAGLLRLEEGGAAEEPRRRVQADPQLREAEAAEPDQTEPQQEHRVRSSQSRGQPARGTALLSGL